jgi:hypothetical protein
MTDVLSPTSASTATRHAAREARVEPVGKPLNEHDFDRSGGGNKVTERNKICSGSASEPQ